MWVLESPRARQLLALLADAPLSRWDLDVLIVEQGWRVALDTADSTGYLGMDVGWGFEQGYGLLLYLDDGDLAVITAALGPYTPATTRTTLLPVLLTVSRRYGIARPADDGLAWDTGTGRLLVVPENGTVIAVWASHRYLARPGGLPDGGLSMRVLEHLVSDAAAGPGWADAVTRATQLVPASVSDMDRWAVTAAVALMIDVTANERGVTAAQVTSDDIAEPLAAVLAAVTSAPDRPQ